MLGHQESTTNRVEEYSLADFALGRLSSEESLKVLDFIERNDAKNKELDDIIRILALGSYVRGPESGRNELDQSGPRPARVSPSFLSVISRMAAVVLVVVGGVLVAGERSKPKNLELIEANAADIDVTTRSRSDGVVAIAYALLLEGDNRRASELLNWCVEVLPDGEDLAYAHLVRGGMLLIDSKQEHLGVFSHFDTNLVNLGLAELEMASRESAPRRVRECADWLAAKGNLMIGEELRAIQYLNDVEEAGGIRQAEAKSLRLILTGHAETRREP